MPSARHYATIIYERHAHYAELRRRPLRTPATLRRHEPFIFRHLR